jgi:predicted Zn-dependent protease
VHLELKDYKKAEMLTYELLKIDYYNYYGNIYMIQALIAQKKYKIAKSMTQKMLNLYPTDIAYLELLSIVYKKTGSKYLHDLYENILILDPNNILVRSEMK